MGDLTILRPCLCGAPGRPRHVLANGKPIGEADVCDDCMDAVNHGHTFSVQSIKLFEDQESA